MIERRGRVGPRSAVVRPRRAFLIVAVMLATAPGVAGAGQADSAQTASDTAQASPPIEPIAASEVTSAAERTLRRLAELRSELRPTPDPDLQSINENLPAVKDTVTELLAVLDTLEGGLGATRDLWNALQAQLERLRAWRETLDGRNANLTSWQAELQRMDSTWRVTRAEAVAESYPAALITRVESVLSEVRSVSDQLLGRLSDVLTLVDEVSQEELSAEQAIDEIELSLGEVGQRLFSPDSPPLWEAILNPSIGGSLAEQAGESWRADSSELLGYLRAETQRAVWHLALFAALLFLTVSFRRRGREELRDGALHGSVHILNHPFSAALLVSLVFTRVIHPSAPDVVYELAGLVILIPVLRLLPGLVSPRLRLALYVLSGLYVLHFLQASAIDRSTLQRLLLLAESLAALAMSVWLLRGGIEDGETEELEARVGVKGRRARLVPLVARLGMVAFAVSALANVLGFSALAGLLMGGTLRSALVAIVLYAAVQVLKGLVSFALRSRPARTLRTIRDHVDVHRQRLFVLIRLAAVIGWVVGTLIAFDSLYLVWNWVSRALDRTWSVGAIDFSLGSLVALAIGVWIAVLASRLLRQLVEEDILPRIDLPRGVPASISRMVHYTLLALGVMFALAAAGIDLSRLTIVVGALGVGIGFGLQNIVNNFISGLILIFERPVQLGDTIEVDSFLCTVQRIGIRSSTVRTIEGAEVIVPNGDLITGKVINWTLSDRQRRIEALVGVAYGTDPERVQEILLKVAEQHPEVLESPEPMALFLGFGDSSLNFALRCWTGEFKEWFRIASELRVAINRALADAKITIPFPQRDLHLKSVDQSVPGQLSLTDAADPPVDPKPSGGGKAADPDA